MKNKLFILLCFLGIGLCSCNDWLDVKPQTEVEVGKMFERQQGFQDALTGAYLDMKSSNAYGEDMTYGSIEYLAQHWTYSTGDRGEAISRYNYINSYAQGVFETMYSKLYTIIADVNEILENIDAHQDVFEKNMYGMIKGEALAIRAYCHFDLLRLFGPMPSNVQSGVILPYVKTVSIQNHEHHTYTQYVDLLEEDLTAADSLLKVSDPICEFEILTDTLNITAATKDFMRKRQVRFNYYAVKALEARFYLWLGDEASKTKAYSCAMEVIGALDKDEKNIFELGTSKSISNMDFAFSSEHIMAIYDYELYTNANEAFRESVSYSKPREIVMADLYPAGTTDIRFTGLWTEVTTANQTRMHVIKKYWQKDESNGINQIPLLRLSEMYFIAMECGSLDMANQLYDAFCIARNIPSVNIQSAEQLKTILIEEYNKEFYAEGQTFYAYKRLAVEDILWASDPGDEEAYVVPLPSSEINYGK